VPAVQGKFTPKCVRDVQYGALYGGLYDGFVRSWKWTCSGQTVGFSMVDERRDRSTGFSMHMSMYVVRSGQTWFQRGQNKTLRVHES
jgi:hypothetical protein